MAGESKSNNDSQQKKESTLKVIIHSFIVIPFIVAAAGVLFFFMMSLLTMEKQTAYDHLNDIKVGGQFKRWQAAYELSRLLNKPDAYTMDQRFVSEMINTFRQAEHDDKKVRQYLALAMGRTGNFEFVDFLIETLPGENEDNIPFVINALGMLKDKRAAKVLHPFLQHNNPGVRLQTVIALGEIGDKGSLDALRNSLQDPEPNVKWDAAMALVKMGSSAGIDVLLNLLDESYLIDFKNVDYNERNHAILSAINASAMLDDPVLNQAITELSESAENMEVRKAALQALNK